MKKYIVLGGMALLAPSIALAAGLTNVINTVGGIIEMLVPLVISLAVLFFLWGLVMFMTKAGEEKDNARSTMIWGIIILFVMVSIWGLVKLVQDTFDIDGGNGSNIQNPVGGIR